VSDDATLFGADAGRFPRTRSVQTGLFGSVIMNVLYFVNARIVIIGNVESVVSPHLLKIAHQKARADKRFDYW
jgi:hypothetical protein